jgi:hypothetical protein
MAMRRARRFARLTRALSVGCICAEFLNEGGIITVADHEVDEIQSIEQSLGESACGDSIEERLGGAGDKPNRGRWTTRQFKRSEYVNQHVLNDGRHLLNVGDQQAAAAGSIK